MNVLLVSQCSKRALVETRRILDQFAGRCGDCTWQTAITQEGLNTLRKLLKKTARRNTSVACHWVRGKNRTELLWLVGNPRRFNAQGAVPTNTTTRDVLRSRDENQWLHGEAITLLSSLAALFHDFGKAGLLFQQKLAGKGPGYEPYRHEWLSLRMFEALVHGCSDDAEWLQKLTELTAKDEQSLWQHLVRDGLDGSVSSPLKHLPPLAKAVGWLVLTHHRLPQCPKDGKEQPIKYLEQFLEKAITSSWNSTNHDKEWPKESLQQVWQSNHGTPINSRSWCAKVARVADRALKHPSLLHSNWLKNPFALHLARLQLMLADHWYSGQSSQGRWSDDNYPVYANTYRDGPRRNQFNQKLDEHLIGVYRSAHQMARLLPGLKPNLPHIARHPELKKRTTKAAFAWQNKAYDLACSLREHSEKQGFFGINMASTGRGKTFANARIAYGLSDPQQGCRFSVALGLRALTLQTGDAMKALLRLNDEDMAVMVGGQAVQALHKLQHSRDFGSESADDFLGDDQYISYEGNIGGPLEQWLQRSPRLQKLVSAPVLVSTIDHLMPATESDRGGQQIAPMLRLLSSDIILDEPDDFALQDLPALTRLVNWAGMLGSRVVLSSATLPPSLVEVLFEAYCAGRQVYQDNCGEPGLPLNVSCAWFDEFASSSSSHHTLAGFREAHQRFAQQRMQYLNQQTNKRLAQLLPIRTESAAASDVIHALAQLFHRQIHQLHRQHHSQNQQGQQLSVGLIRCANINPLVALAQQLLTLPAEPGYRIHYCVYHSQHPLAVRSAIENDLDTLLNRKQEQAIWQHPLVREALQQHPDDKHIMVVLGTSVTEVGRDHDYDWAIAEPSSMRSLIQLAGRISRHRDYEPGSANLLVMNQNIRALRQRIPAYIRPGFESEQSDGLRLKQHRLEDILTSSQLNPLNANARICERPEPQPSNNLVDLEHEQLRRILFAHPERGDKTSADIWWHRQAHTTFELQRRTRFRQSMPSQDFYLLLEDEQADIRFCQWSAKHQEESDQSYDFDITKLAEPARGISLLGHYDYRHCVLLLAEQMDQDIADICRRFGGVSLSTGSDQKWCYQPRFGFYRPL